MGSCENSTLTDEPLCESIPENRSCVEFPEKPVSEPWGCSETGSGMIGANVNAISVLDGYLGTTNKDKTCFGGCDDVKETGIVKRDVVLGECGNVVGVGLEGLEDDECGVSGVGLNESKSEIGVCNSPSSFLVLSGDESNICVSSDDVIGMDVGNRDELVSVCENMVGSVYGEFGVCLNETQSDVDVFCIETDGLCLEKRVFQVEDEYVKSLEGCETPLGETPVNTSARSHDQLDAKKDDREVNVPSLEGTVEVMEDKKDVLTEVKVVAGKETFLPEGSGMILESMPVTNVPRNCLQQHEHKDDKIVGCLPVEEEKNEIALAGVEKETSDEILPSWTSEATPTTGSVRNCVQQGDQKDVKNTVCPPLEGAMEVMEEKTDTLGGIEKNTCDQMLPSQYYEKHAELVPLPSPLRNFVHQDDLKNDKGIGSSSSEGVEEFVEENTNASGQMLLPQACTMPLELTSGTCSPRDCIEQNQQKGDFGTAEVMKEKDYALDGIEKDFCEQVLSLQDCTICSGSTYVTSSIEEFVEEKRDFLDGTQTDSCHPRSPSEYNDLHTDIVRSAGLSSISTQKTEQETESISDPGVEQKTDASGSMEANMCSWILSSDVGEIPSESLCKDDLLSGGGHNDQKDHDSFSHQDEEAIQNVNETKSNDDECVPALPTQSCQSSLEDSLLTASVCNHIQQNEQRSDRSVDRPSADSVNEVLEEKSDVTTDGRVEISTQVLPVEESLKDDSSKMALNGAVEKLVSLQSCQPFGVDENSSSNKLDVTDLFQKDPLAAISSSSAVDSSGQTGHEEKDNVRVDCFSETKYPDIVSSSARRSSSRISSSSRKDQTKRVARNCRRRAEVQNSRGSIDIIFKFVRRKRSFISKRARSSIWGLLGNIAQVFNESDVTFSQVQNEGSQKPRGGRGSRKQNKIQAGKSSLGSNGKCHASTKCIRLKVKVGKEVCQRSLDVTVPEMVDNAASDDTIIGDQRTSESPKLTHGFEDKSGEEETEGQFQCFNKNPEETEKRLDDSILDVDLANKEDGNLILSQSNGDVADDNLGIPADKRDEVVGGEIENNYVDPGTSPDSEVIDVVPDAQVGPGSQEGLIKTVLTSSTAVAAKHVTTSKRGKKKDNLLLEGNCILEGSSHVAVRLNKTKPPKKRGGRQKTGDGSSESLSALSGANTSSNSMSSEEFFMEPLPSVEEIELGGEGMAPAFKSKQRSASKSSKSAGMRKGRSKASGSEWSRRKNAPGVNQRKSANKRKVKEKGVSIKKGKENGVCDQVEAKTKCHPEIGNHIANDGERIESDNTSASDVAKMGIASSGVPEHCAPPDGAWVRCDECYKWRRIQVALADAIDENCRWVCKDNMDKAFADCSIPQEKTNADINAELGLSDCEEDDGLSNYNRSEKEFHYGNKSAFRRIDSNVFLHRGRKTQTIDEIMVCHCKQPRDGRLGCGDECLNRMLNIECVQGTCPCGDLCSNQQFQKRRYAKMEWQRFGKKGYGLKLLQSISKGQFIIEYVGEVLDMQAYEARQKEYAANGHKHFYFMTLNGSEVIDACAKGNLGRFINHSCDPNCRTEKWMVNGEICIGLFALRDIKEGEELTFDYNYVRVFGAAAKKCHCGSPLCRGYIGGDPLNTEVIYQGDSDEEYPEPLMIENGESGDDLEVNTCRTSSFPGDRTQYALEDRDKMDDDIRAVGRLEITTEVEDFRNQSAYAISQVHSSSELEDSRGRYPSAQSDISMQLEDGSSRSMSAVGQNASMEEETKNSTLSLVTQVETSSPTIISSKLLLCGDDASRKGKSDIVEQKQGLPKSHPRIKTSRSSGSLKKGKLGSIPLNGNKVKPVANKSQLFSFKPKKSVEGSSNGRFEAVQEKLNELLDADGGISKRKDAPKGYLKLLLLTAASGHSGNGEAIQSNRDLSMILDALLKTKSRVVLLDIINKNGLQMLHNMMKQYRRDFKKTPILRKLLKVLEYLAVREILTRDHITGGPPCAGMESFRESILSLTEHDDKQVHQIARNFRDKWIPKPVRKSSYTDRDDGRMDFHRGVNCNRHSTLHNHWHDQGSRPTEAIDCVMQSLLTTSVDSTANEAGLVPCTDGCQNNGSKTRKRKTRWDQPAKINLDSKSVIHKEQKLESASLQQYESIPLPKRSQVVVDHPDKLSREDSCCLNCDRSHYSRDEAVRSEDGGHITQEDVPPGFSSPLNPPVVSSDASSTTDLPQQNVSHLKCLCDVAIGHPQGKFISRLPVSYGIPLHILQQFGSPQAETVDSWVIAPGMPFHPFPPLPPFPRGSKDAPPACAVSCKTANESAEEWQQDSHHLPTCDPEEDSPSTTGANQSDADTQGTDTQQPFKRMRVSSNDLGRRYFRQQKRKGPPWLWRRNELRGSYCSQDVCNRVDKPSSNFYQRPSQQNHH